MKKILRLNSSGIKDSSCMRKVLFTCHLGYTGKRVANDMVYGSAFHKYVETWEQTSGDHQKSLMAALQYWTIASTPDKMYVKDKKQFLDVAHLTNTCTKFSMEYKRNPIFMDRRVLKIHDTVMVEQKFSIKLLETDDYELYLQGTLDKISSINGNGIISLDDWKTTTAWNSDEYFESYKMSLQLRLYVWALYKLCKQYPDGEFARVIWPDKERSIVAYINGVFLKASGAEFKRSSEMKYTPRDMEEFEAMLSVLCMAYVKNVTDYDKRGLIPPSWGIMTGACNAPFGGLCQYFKACSSRVGLSTPEATDRITLGILEADFCKREYKPLEFGGEGKITTPTVGVATETTNNEK